ncbi:VOC family protein [Terriglobus sp. TAA 43]|uniref:VOC family protein n=1 Tax=Terriglobus sp. TAA 43 TaxID=278961 RepID=UPI0018DB2D7C|nr:VOC family protein [Terriglobus sp. TAA 43]
MNKNIAGLALWSAMLLPALHAQVESPSAAQKPAIVGIAHVAIRVADLQASRAFYEKLGFAQPFEITKDGKVTEAFIKLNDRQYLELYPADAGQTAAFLHVCFEAVNLPGLYPIYTANGVVAPPVRKAGAGNMLLAWKGPEGQTEEITEYLPGSKHSNDFGQHLDGDRIATHLAAAVVPMKDPAATAEYFIQKMNFVDGGVREGAHVTSPAGGKDGSFAFLSQSSPEKLVLVFTGVKEKETLRKLQKQGLPATVEHHRVLARDPDGNLLVFTSH